MLKVTEAPRPGEHVEHLDMAEQGVARRELRIQRPGESGNISGGERNG
jgi:hypothetical protein